MRDFVSFINLGRVVGAGDGNAVDLTATISYVGAAPDFQPNVVRVM